MDRFGEDNSNCRHGKTALPRAWSAPVRRNSFCGFSGDGLTHIYATYDAHCVLLIIERVETVRECLAPPLEPLDGHAAATDNSPADAANGGERAQSGGVLPW